MAIGTGAAIIGGSMLVGGGLSMIGASKQASAANRAADLQAQVTREGVAEQRRQHDMARQDLAPYRLSGANALADIMRGFGYDVTLGNAFTGQPFTSAPEDSVPATAQAGTKQAHGMMTNPGGPITPVQEPGLLDQFDAELAALEQEQRDINMIGADSPRESAQRLLDMRRDALQRRINEAGGVLQGGKIFAGQDLIDTSKAKAEPPEADPTFMLTRSGQPGEFNTPLVFDPGEEFRTPLVFEFDPSRLAEDEGYQFRLNEGLRAQRANAAASGMMLSGDALREAQRFGEGLASSELNNAFQRQLTTFGTRVDDRNNRLNTLRDIYNSQVTDRANRFNRLATLAGIGQTATNTGVQAGQNAANSITAALMSGGARQGAAMMAGGNAWAGGFNRLGDSVMQAGKAFAKGLDTPAPNADWWRSGGGTSGIGTL